MGASPLGISVTLITLLNRPSQAACLGGYSKAAGFFQPLQQLAVPDPWGDAGVGSKQDEHAERLSTESVFPKASMGL